MKTTLSFWQRTVLAVSAIAALGVIVTSASFLPLSAAQAQTKKAAQKVAKKQKVKSAPTKSRGESGATDPEIKDPNKKGDPHPYRPKSKGGTKSRGEKDGVIHFNNYSHRFIAAYVDGYYKGEIPPYGDLILDCDTPSTYRLFAKQVTTGATYGPKSVYISEGGSFEWQLDDDE